MNNLYDTKNYYFLENNIKNHFPIFDRLVNGKRLIWFDNGATTQKPRCVIDKISKFYEYYNSNIHRGDHTLSIEASNIFDEAREHISNFINAKHDDEILFTKGTTEGMNLLAQTLSDAYLKFGDEIILTKMEHHSNIVPWQNIAEKKGIKIRYIDVLPDGTLDYDSFLNLLNKKSKILSLTHVSNVLGTINPIHKFVNMAKSYGLITIVDGAQAIAHLPVDVRNIGCDFYVFSGHKMYGPTGIGVLYGTRNILEEIGPYQSGGGMIGNVTLEGNMAREVPHKFEAGTSNIEGVFGLYEAVKYIESIGYEKIQCNEELLTNHALSKLRMFDSIKILRAAKNRAGVISFNHKNITPRELAKKLDVYGIATRGGHHCAIPIHRHFGFEESIRISFGVYNTQSEVDYFVEILTKIL